MEKTRAKAPGAMGGEAELLRLLKAKEGPSPAAQLDRMEGGRMFHTIFVGGYSGTIIVPYTFWRLGGTWVKISHLQSKGSKNFKVKEEDR